MNSSIIDNDDIIGRARKRAFIIFCIAGGGFATLHNLVFLFIDFSLYPVVAVAYTIAPAVFPIVGVILTRIKNPKPFYFGLLLYSLIGIGTIIFLAGGPMTRTTFFLAGLCLIAAYVLHWRWALAYFASSIGILIAAHFYSIQANTDLRYAFPTLTYQEASFWVISCFIIVLILGGGATLFYAREMHRATYLLKEARREAELASRAKSEFLANMSHEIRTPMNGVLGLTELLRKSSLNDQQEQYAKAAYKSGTALLKILDDILDFSKIEAGAIELDPTPFSIRETAKDIVTLLSVTAREKKVALRADIAANADVYVSGDIGRVRQVLVNLIGNALKFTHQGEVVLRVTANTIGTDINLQFDIEDTGIGIAADKIDHIFKEFTQAEGATTRKYGGTGLGLAITKSLVETMGGSISAASTLGRGSTFTVRLTLPAALQAHQREAPETSVQRPAHGCGKYQLLIAEDNEVNQLIIKGMLSAEQYELTFANNGQEALSHAQQRQFDAIFMDISMPEMDGMEATKAIRAFETENSLEPAPIIALTAHAMNGDRERFLNAGMDGYASKPVTQAKLLAALALALDAGAERMVAAG